MKRILFPILTAALLTAIVPTADAKKKGKLYGATFTESNVMEAKDLSTKMGSSTNMPNVVVKGKIAQVCQAEGCWIKLKNDAGEDVFVKFKDHAFLIPKDLAGKQAVVFGTAVKKTVSVEERRHLAEDAGASKEDISAITEPREELRIEATGIRIM